MGRQFAKIAFTPLVKKQQELHGSRRQYQRIEQAGEPSVWLGEDERAFIEARDGFYMASVSETGWPYIQFRGGPKGFLHVLKDNTLGFADLRGNKQYISVGNLQHDDRVALFLMDYVGQQRLKILGRTKIFEGNQEAQELITKLRTAEHNGVPERAITISVEAFDWNCPQHITPRFTAEEIEPMVAALRSEVAALKAENVALRRAQQSQPGTS